MSDKISRLWSHVGRVLLALYFLLPGAMKLLSPSLQLSMMEHHHIPYAKPLLYIAGIAQIIGALMLLANRYVRFASLGFVLYIIIINALMHDFWHFDGMEGAHELQNFMKNLGILAGLLVLAGHSPRGSK